jgi:hypothetical protein
MIDLGAIGQKHIGKGAPVLVDAVGMELGFNSFVLKSLKY